MTRDMAHLKAFLFEAVYHNRRILDVMADAEQIVRDLFDRYNSEAGAALLPDDWREAFLKLGYTRAGAPRLRLSRRPDRSLRARRAPAIVCGNA